MFVRTNYYTPLAWLKGQQSLEISDLVDRDQVNANSIVTNLKFSVLVNIHPNIAICSS
jgi:hypothetical protein